MKMYEIRCCVADDCMAKRCRWKQPQTYAARDWDPSWMATSLGCSRSRHELRRRQAQKIIVREWDDSLQAS